MKNLLSHTATLDATADMRFPEQCRRQLARPLEVRMKYGFCRISRPGFDEPAVRVLKTTRADREWCEANLPAYLGYQQAPAE